MRRLILCIVAALVLLYVTAVAVFFIVQPVAQPSPLTALLALSPALTVRQWSKIKLPTFGKRTRNSRTRLRVRWKF